MSQVNTPFEAYVCLYNQTDEIASVQYFNNDATNAQTAVVQR